MRFWNGDAGLMDPDIPERIAAIADAVGDVLEGNDLQLVGIGRGERDVDFSRFRVEIELEPGLTLPIEYGTFDALDESWEAEEDDVDEIAAAVDDAVRTTLPDVGELSEIVHRARVSARRIVGRWNADGISSRLIAVQLAPRGDWIECSKPSLHVDVENIDDALRPEALTIVVTAPDLLVDAMAEWREGVARGYARRAEMARLGASGTVSRLALNAMGHFGPVDESLRRFGRERRFWLPDDTAIVMMDGHVRAGTGDADADIHWSNGRVEVSGLHIPPEDLLAAVGGPVRALVDHPFLSDDIVVTGASRSFDNGDPTVAIDFTSPRLLFCATTGRVWAEEQVAARDATPADPPGANVIPFARVARR